MSRRFPAEPCPVPTDTIPLRGLTTADVAKLLRVSKGKVIAWIRRGELAAVNTASPRAYRPRFIILPHAIEAFAAARSPAVPPKQPKRRKKQIEEIDYFPDLE